MGFLSFIFNHNTFLTCYFYVNKDKVIVIISSAPFLLKCLYVLNQVPPKWHFSATYSIYRCTVCLFTLTHTLSLHINEVVWVLSFPLLLKCWNGVVIAGRRCWLAHLIFSCMYFDGDWHIDRRLSPSVSSSECDWQCDSYWAFIPD